MRTLVADSDVRPMAIWAVRAWCATCHEFVGPIRQTNVEATVDVHRHREHHAAVAAGYEIVGTGRDGAYVGHRHEPGGTIHRHRGGVSPHQHT